MTTLSSSTTRGSLLPAVIAALTLLLAPVTYGQTPDQKCNDPVPPICTHAKFLGTDKSCSCFVCNPDDRAKRIVVCTRNEADRKILFGRVDPPKRPALAAAEAETHAR